MNLLALILDNLANTRVNAIRPRPHGDWTYVIWADPRR